MNDLDFHFAPNLPWVWILLAAAVALGVSAWAYRFRMPPLPRAARALLPALRALALITLVALLAQPVLERARQGPARVIALVDRSASMDLGGAGEPTRAERAAGALEQLRRAWRGRATVEVMGFAARLEPDTGAAGNRGATALGDALAALARTPAGPAAGGVVVISDGAVNAGEDPVVAARALGIPVHAVVVGDPDRPDRALSGIEAPARARAGEATPVRVRVTSSEPRGTPLTVTLEGGGRELGRARVLAPGGGAEATAEFRVRPSRAGLALWTARVDSLAAEATAANNARQVAIEVAPGKLGVRIVTRALNWDLTFLRRALAADSSLEVVTWAPARGAWAELEAGTRGGPPGEAALRGAAVVVLDAIEPAAVSPEFDRALAAFVRGGGGLLLLGGPAPGASRFATGALARELAFGTDGTRAAPAASPQPSAEARELLQWDDDPARGDRAWRAAAPLTEPAPLVPAAGDRVLIAGGSAGPPLLLARRIGRGQALIVNGTGVWRWSLNAHDDLAAERGVRLWRRIARWLAEPVQGEPLRVRPERWLTAGGDPLRLFATLQDQAFRPVAGARVRGEIAVPGGGSRRVTFEAAEAGAYVATLDDLPPGRHRIAVRAEGQGRELGRAAAEFAVDVWSAELARPEPDSTLLAAVAAASGGRVTPDGAIEPWARSLETSAMARVRRDSARLWESPWVFAAVIAALGVEWVWRRRRGLP